ncbi:MAG TPA: hypothetical protein VLB81_05080 [Gaiellales bacterium]|nr:hypothetical protein [Gaiellales bacterium]
MLPAHERLEASDAAVPQAGLRLVVDNDLAAVERVAQLADKRQPLRRVVVGRGVVDLHRGARVLGDVHRDVRTLQESVNLVAVVGVDGDADADPDIERDVVKHKRHGERRPDSRSKVGRGGFLHDARHEDRELVASQPGERVASP